MLIVNLRWICGADYEAAVEINNLIFDEEMTKGDFEKMVREENFVTNIAEYDGKVIGFIIYEISKWKYEIKKVAVSSRYHRKGVGRQMVEKLLDKLNPDKKHRVLVHVGEKNLAAQLFFKSLGFECTRIVPKHETEALVEDEYVFVKWTAKGKKDVQDVSE